MAKLFKKLYVNGVKHSWSKTVISFIDVLELGGEEITKDFIIKYEVNKGDVGGNLIASGDLDRNTPLDISSWVSNNGQAIIFRITTSGSVS